jgi:nucleotide-binding universal stress UspA family protein
VKATAVVDAFPQLIRDTILTEAGKADLIAMGAESGPWTTALVGSIARDVVREAHCPVWLLRA